MDTRLTLPFRALRIALGLTATLAGFDKFFNILADWGSYVSPAVAQLLPVPVPAFMAIVGIVEIVVGASILRFAPRFGAYVASAWLLLIALNLVIGGRFDIAVRDVVMSISALTLARGLEVEGTSQIRAGLTTAAAVSALAIGLVR